MVRTGQASLVVLSRTVNKAIPAYLAALDFRALSALHPAEHFYDDPPQNFHFAWRYYAGKELSQEHNHALRHLGCCFPPGPGLDALCLDINTRAEAQCAATRQDRVICQLRFAASQIPSDVFHTDDDCRFTGGTAYVNTATGFIDAQYLNGLPEKSQRRHPSNPGLAEHIQYPDLYAQYLLRTDRDHTVPPFQGNRITLIMR